VTSAWQDWLADPSRTGTSPPEVVASVIASATSSVAVTTTRLLHGESNEVYDATTEDGQRVVVRLNPRRPSLFPAERWAIERAAAAGVPLPEVLLGEEGVCVERHAGGLPLQDVARSLPREAVRAAVVEAGRALARIHAVRTDGWGWPLDAEGRGSDPDLATFLAMPAREPQWFRPGAEAAGYDLAKFDTATAILEARAEDHGLDGPRLVHADWGAKHVLVDETTGELRALIDFETARGGEPAYDIAAWDLYFRDTLKTRWLLEGYREIADVDDERIALNRLLFAIRLLGHAAGGFTGFVPLATAAIDEAITSMVE
jgi:Ser/Thr protein kinase RdoA (MazF antagonist)